MLVHGINYGLGLVSHLSCDFSQTIAVIMESIDDLVREAEGLKTRLEEERAKFNDIECMHIKIFCFSIN
jgi:hypothetical protein